MVEVKDDNKGDKMNKQEEIRDSITIDMPVIPRGLKHCEACGKFVSGRCMVCHAKRDSRYVCNVMCGIRVCDA